MNLILKASGSDFILPDVGVIILHTGSDFSSIPGLVRALGQSLDLRNHVIAGTVVVNNGSTDLSSLAGQQYLNQMWLQSGHDIAVQMAQVEGVISDTQHGSRGGGTLHPDSTTSVAGFMSATDKTKIDAIGQKAANRILLTFGDQVNSGVSQTGTTPLVVRYFTFQGSGAVGSLLTFKTIANRTGAGTGVVRVQDITNGQTIVTVTNINTASPTIYTGAPANLPTGEAIFTLEIYSTTGGTKITCHSVEFF